MCALSRSGFSRFSSAPAPRRARSFPGRLRYSLLASRSVSPSPRQRASRWVTSSSCSSRPTRSSAERRCSSPAACARWRPTSRCTRASRAAGIPDASREAQQALACLGIGTAVWAAMGVLGVLWCSGSLGGSDPMLIALAQVPLLALACVGAAYGYLLWGLGAKGDAVHAAGNMGSMVLTFLAAHGSRRRAWARR